MDKTPDDFILIHTTKLKDFNYSDNISVARRWRTLRIMAQLIAPRMSENNIPAFVVHPTDHPPDGAKGILATNGWMVHKSISEHLWSFSLTQKLMDWIRITIGQGEGN